MHIPRNIKIKNHRNGFTAFCKCNVDYFQNKKVGTPIMCLKVVKNIQKKK